MPGSEALLDSWRIKPRKSAEYGDIFDGDMCRVHLKAPDGTLFFRIFLTKDKVLGGAPNWGEYGTYYYLILFQLIFTTGSLTSAATSPHHTRRARRRFQFAISHLNIGEFLLRDDSLMQQ